MNDIIFPPLPLSVIKVMDDAREDGFLTLATCVVSWRVVSVHTKMTLFEVSDSTIVRSENAPCVKDAP